MKHEVERRFLLRDKPDSVRFVDLTHPLEILQGYLCIGESTRHGRSGDEVRLRQVNGRCFITVKHETDDALERGELETEILTSQFEALWLATSGRRIAKERCVGYLDSNGSLLTVEVDFFLGKKPGQQVIAHQDLSGLVIAEIEFLDRSAATKFVPPEDFGREITDDLRYRNRNLAVGGRPLNEM